MNSPAQTMLDDELANMLRAIGHPVRLRILRILGSQGQRECCCTDVTQSLPLAQSTVSQHIKVLMEAGLIERQARGTRNCYSVRTDRVHALSAVLSGLLAELGEPLPESPLCRTQAQREPA